MAEKTKCEAPALGAAVQRMLKALTRRAIEGDTEALEELLKIEASASAMSSLTIAGMRGTYSLAELARITGTSRPAVLKRARRADTYVEPPLYHSLNG